MKNIWWSQDEKIVVAQEFVRLSLQKFSTAVCLESAQGLLSLDRRRGLYNLGNRSTNLTTILKTISKEVEMVLTSLNISIPDKIVNSWSIYHSANPWVSIVPNYVSDSHVKNSPEPAQSPEHESIEQVELALGIMLDSSFLKAKIGILEYFRTVISPKISKNIAASTEQEVKQETQTTLVENITLDNEANELLQVISKVYEKAPRIKILPRVIVMPVVKLALITKQIKEVEEVEKEVDLVSETKIPKNTNNLPNVLIVGLLGEQLKFVEQIFGHAFNLRNETSYNSGLLSVIQKSTMVLAFKRTCSSQTLSILRKHSKAFHVCENLAEMKNHLKSMT